MLVWLSDEKAYSNASDIANENLNDVRYLSLASDITSLATGVMSPKHLGLAVHLHHQFGSRKLIDDIYKLGHHIIHRIEAVSYIPRGGPHPRYVFRGRRGLLLRPPHVRDFVKEGYFFVPRYKVWGSKSPYNSRNIHGSDAE